MIVESFYAGLLEGIGITGFVMGIIMRQNSKKYLARIKRVNRILVGMCDRLRSNPKFSVMENQKID